MWRSSARPTRIGLSATQKPMSEIAAFLTGLNESARPLPCRILDLGHRRELKLWIETTDAPLQALATHDHWGAVYDRLAELILQHRTTLIFVNRRSLAERVAHELGNRVGKEHVSGHHGSLSKERRHVMEQRLKSGDLKAVVATASLELGIDIGSVDLVCQIGSPRRIATFLQRVGRSGHALGLVPHGALFPTSLDELVDVRGDGAGGRAGRPGSHPSTAGADRDSGAADRGGGGVGGGMGRGRSLPADAPGGAVCGVGARGVRRDGGDAGDGRRRGRGGAPIRSSTATGSTASCDRAGRRG